MRKIINSGTLPSLGYIRLGMWLDHIQSLYSIIEQEINRYLTSEETSASEIQSSCKIYEIASKISLADAASCSVHALAVLALAMT
jgi:hypothetical protein